MNKFLVSVWVIASLVSIILISTFGTISTWTRWIVYKYWVAKELLNEWPYFVTPFISNVDEYDIRTQKDEVSTSASSKDLQTVTVNIAVNYSIQPDKLIWLITSVWADYTNRIISPSIQEAIKASTAKFTAEELVTKRESIRADIQSLLIEKISPYGIKVDGINITNFEFSPWFNAAIELKVTAEQNALAQKNKLEQVKYEAQQTIEKAKAEAESIRIQAESVNSQGGSDYIKLQWIEKVGSRWNGQLPTTALGEDTNMFINPK